VRGFGLHTIRMSGYANAQLLTTPADLDRALRGTQAARHRPAAARGLRRRPHSRRGHLDLWGLSLVDTDPGPLKAFMWIVDHLFNLRGVDAGRPVVVYDEQSGMRAAARSGSSSTSAIRACRSSTAASAPGQRGLP
jgi:hypothetical protein